MTSAQLAWRLMRHCTPSDPSALTMSQAAEIAGAMSSALSRLFRHGPTVNRRSSASVIMPAPTTKTINLNNQDRTVNSGSPFSPSQKGASILIDGDSNLNEIVGSNELLNAYMCPAGSHSATIYGDAVPIRTDKFEKLISDPWIQKQGGQVVHLKRVRNDTDPSLRDRHWDYNSWLNWRTNAEVGDPRYYAIQEVGISRNAQAFFLIRVWPAPNDAMTLRFEVDAMPDLFDYTNIFQVPTEVPASDSEVEDIVLPFAEKNLLRSTLYQNVTPETRRSIEQAAMEAEAEIQLLPRSHGIPHSKIRTKRGF